MLSTTKILLRVFRHQYVVNVNKIMLQNVNTRNYCQYKSIINDNITQLKNKEENIVSIQNSTLESIKVPDVSSDVIDVSNFTLTPAEEIEIRKYDEAHETSVLEPSDQDVSHMRPILPATETFARYANHSETIQMLADLGVHLFKWEGNDKIMNLIINLEKEQLEKYILFFHKTLGIPLEELGPMLTKCPYILGEKLKNLRARVGYLQSKKFTDEAIAGIVAKNPMWLEFRVEQIDERLGYFQRTFKLTGDQVRAVCAKLPKVITKKKKWLMEVTFAAKEQMGFSPAEIKKMFLEHPRMWTQDAAELVRTFEYVQNEMGISHDDIAKVPQILTTRRFRLDNRHKFLKSLNKNQYDPKRENYVGLLTLITGDDAEFCTSVAKVTPETYNLFLKSL